MTSPAPDGHRKPLDGIRVLDVGTFLAGPVTATHFAEFGAHVIKVEQPGVGDPMRYWGGHTSGHSLLWSQEGRNKKSVTCNLRTPQGQELVRRLVQCSDIVIENYRPGTLEKWHLGYEELRAVKPDIIMVRVSGYGQTGPNAWKPGFARVGQAYGGLTYLAGEPSGPPLTPGTTTLADYITPLFTAFGTMVALRHRDRFGEGQVVDMSLYEATFRILDTLTVDYSKEGFVRDRTSRHGARYACPHGQFPCKDGTWLALACTTDRMWQRFSRAVGRDDLARDSRYATTRDRLARRDEVNGIVDGITMQYTRKELLDLLDKEEAAVGPVNSIADIFADPHYWERESIITAHDPIFGNLAMPGVFPKLSLTPGAVEHTGPAVVGQHNQEVYCDLLGLSPQELGDLKAGGVI